VKKPILITRVPSPPASLLENALPRLDYADAFRGEIRPPGPLQPEDVFKALFGSTPRWIDSLLFLRNKLVARVGLKVPSQSPRHRLEAFQVAPGQSLGLFKIMAKNNREVLAGQDDRHLDFRVSFLLETLEAEGTPAYGFTLTTGVTMHNRLGRFYFALVKPFHRLIVPAMMRGIIRNLQGP
jgi:hypothetical protein